MYELKQIRGNTYYIAAPAKIGLYITGEGTAVLMDSGNDKQAAKKVLRRLEEAGLTAQALYTTHSNADHIGGCRFLQNRLDIPVYAPALEDAFTRHPLLEPSFLYGGYPNAALRNKFLMAEEARVTTLKEDLLPPGLTAFSLPGHYFNMVGYRTDDQVIFLADCLVGEDILNKYHVSFLYDVRAYLETLEAICALKAQVFVPSHGPLTGDIRPLAEANRNKVLEIVDLILQACQKPVSFDELLAYLFDHYSLTMDWNQHVLVGSTLRSYLSYLVDEGRLIPSFEGNCLRYTSEA